MIKLDEHWNKFYETKKDFGYIYGAPLSQILSYASEDLPRTALDLGCGTGQLTRELYHRGFEAVGVDISSDAIAIAQNSTVFGDKLTYVHTDLEQDFTKKLPSKQFSFVFCKLVYAFIEDKNAFLKRAKDVIAEGGIFVLISQLHEDVPEARKKIAIDLDHTTEQLNRHFSETAYFRNGECSYFVYQQRIT